MSWLGRLLRGGRSGRGPQPIRVQLPPAEGGRIVRGDQPLRKAWAEELLRVQGVPVNPGLPMIESEAEISLRSAAEVAQRLTALTLVAAKGAGLDQAIVDEVIEERGMRPLFTPDEAVFIGSIAPGPPDLVRFSWRYEAAWVLLWALGHVEGVLEPPRAMCDVDRLHDLFREIPDLGANGLRPANDILNETDLTYRRHWAVRQAGLDGHPPPAGLHPGVVMERHHALNWLVGYNDGAAWDDVTTDT